MPETIADTSEQAAGNYRKQVVMTEGEMRKTTEPMFGTCRSMDWRAAAEAAVRTYVGWHLAPVITETIQVTARHRSPNLFLPTTRIVDVEKVEVLYRPTGEWVELDPETYEWDVPGLLRRHGCWPRPLRGIRVTLTHGYEPDEIPEVASILDAIEKRSRMNLGGVASQSVNGASVSYLTAGGAPLSTQLLNIEKQALDPYRVGFGRITG